MERVLILDVMAAWRDQGGPELWRAALERTVAFYQPLYAGLYRDGEGVALLEGATGVAVAVYIIAQEQGIPVGQVTRDQVADLAQGYGWDRVARWDTKLRALGHDPDDPDDPVMARWRELRRDCSPPEPDLISEKCGRTTSRSGWGRP